MGERIEVLVDEPGVGPQRTARPPTSTASCTSPDSLGVGEFHKVAVTGAAGPDLWAEP